MGLKTRSGDPLPSHIIIDCSMFSYTDTAGVSQLKRTVQDYQSIGIRAFLAGVATHVDNMLQLDGFYRQVPSHHVYITIQDAVHHAQQEQMGVDLEACDPAHHVDQDQEEEEDGLSVVSKEEGEEGKKLVCTSVTRRDSDKKDERRRLSVVLSPPAAHSHDWYQEPGLMNKHQRDGKSLTSLPSCLLSPPRPSIVGFFEETMVQREEPLTGAAIEADDSLLPSSAPDPRFNQD